MVNDLDHAFSCPSRVRTLAMVGFQRDHPAWVLCSKTGDSIRTRHALRSRNAALGLPPRVPFVDFSVDEVTLMPPATSV